MSIRDDIQKAIGAGRLSLLLPQIPGTPSVRFVFVSEDVRDGVSLPWKEYSNSVFRAQIDAFTSGEKITIAEDPFNKKASAFLARVAPVTDEIWDMRCFDPKPFIRCFGAFSEKDHFVALTWAYRDDIVWDDEIDRFRDSWRNIFGTTKPFSGANLNDYLSGNYRIG